MPICSMFPVECCSWEHGVQVYMESRQRLMHMQAPSDVMVGQGRDTSTKSQVPDGHVDVFANWGIIAAAGSV